MHNMLTNITPNGGNVDGIILPDERVDKHDQAGSGCPEHICASARIQSLEMPCKRNKTQEETKEGKDGVKRECWIDHGVE